MRAVSDAVAAVMLIAIVVVGFFGIVWPLYLRFQSASQSAALGAQRQAMAAETLMAPVYQYAYQANGTTGFYIYIYNYGRFSFAPQELLISLPGGGVYTVTAFSMKNAQTGRPAGSIPPSSVVEISFSLQYSGAVPSYYNLTLIGNGTSFSWEL